VDIAGDHLCEIYVKISKSIIGKRVLSPEMLHLLSQSLSLVESCSQWVKENFRVGYDKPWERRKNLDHVELLFRSDLFKFAFQEGRPIRPASELDVLDEVALRAAEIATPKEPCLLWRASVEWPKKLFQERDKVLELETEFWTKRERLDSLLEAELYREEASGGGSDVEIRNRVANHPDRRFLPELTTLATAFWTAVREQIQQEREQILAQE
jgi:hypothetical protein